MKGLGENSSTKDPENGLKFEFRVAHEYTLFWE